jgi:phage-related protein
LKVVVGSVVNFIADHWRELVPLLLGPLAPLGELATHFGLVKDAAVAAYHGIVDAFGEVFGFFKSLPGEILGFFKDAGKWLYDAGKSIIQGLIDGLESLLGKIGDVVSSILSKLNPLNDVQSLVGSVISHIPGFASGVQNFGGGLAVVGENGPELLDLPSGSSVYPNSVYESLTAPRPLVAAASVPAAGNGATVVYAQFGEETIEARSVRVAHGVVDSRVASAQEREARGVAGSPLKHLARV